MLTARLNRPLLALSYVLEGLAVKTADIITEEAGKIYRKVRLRLEKCVLIPTGPEEGPFQKACQSRVGDGSGLQDQADVM